MKTGLLGQLLQRITPQSRDVTRSDSEERFLNGRSDSLLNIYTALRFYECLHYERFINGRSDHSIGGARSGMSKVTLLNRRTNLVNI